jgi:hypothetical protein
MKRRTFITLLGGAAVARPLAAHAQQPGKLPTIGFLVSGTPSSHGQWVAAFVRRLHELGWIEGRNLGADRGARVGAAVIALREAMPKTGHAKRAAKAAKSRAGKHYGREQH